MQFSEYRTAYKLGKKEISARQAAKLPTDMPALDTILEDYDVLQELPLGIVDIPTELIAGTKTAGRTSSFAPNFMPILDEGTEFAGKWDSLCRAHVDEGIRDPIVAYEFLNRYYVLEGNKRVSVLKYFKASSIPGYVTRVVPVWKDQKDIRINYEYMDFYNTTGINYLTFTKEGSYLKIRKLVGYKKYDRWSIDDRMNFRSLYNRFDESFKDLGGEKLPITTGDALLIYMEVFTYQDVMDQSVIEMKKQLKQMWDEFVIST